MKKHTLLLSLTATIVAPLLTSCYMPPGAYYPPGPGTPPPPPGTPSQPQQRVLHSYRVTGISLVKVPPRRIGNLTWDIATPLRPLARYPDVYGVIKSGSRRVGSSSTRTDYVSGSSGALAVNSTSMRYQNNKVLNISLYDKDGSQNQLISKTSFIVPQPATNVRFGTKTITANTPTGTVVYRVKFSYTWVTR